jgi:hypothetical protein
VLRIWTPIALSAKLSTWSFAKIILVLRIFVAALLEFHQIGSFLPNFSSRAE